MTGFARDSVVFMAYVFLARTAAVIASLFVAALAGAAEPARPGVPAKGPGDGVLTPAQLKACVAQKERLQAQTDSALKDKATIEEERAELARVEAVLAAEQAGVDRESAEAVDAFNAKVQAKAARAQALETRIDAFNARAEGLRSTQDGYRRSCGNRRYDERDLDDLKRVKK
jgi:hypothetical protein